MQCYQIIFGLLLLVVVTKACNSSNKPTNRVETMSSSYSSSSTGGLGSYSSSGGSFNGARISPHTFDGSPFASRFGENTYEETVRQEGKINNVHGVFSSSSVRVDENGRGTYKIVTGKIGN